MSLDKKIEVKRDELNKSVLVKGVSDNCIIKLSEELDKLIVMRMRRMLA